MREALAVLFDRRRFALADRTSIICERMPSPSCAALSFSYVMRSCAACMSTSTSPCAFSASTKMPCSCAIA
jgi:hypothetical protein